MIHRIVASRRQSVLVFIEAPDAAAITPAVIESALAETVTPAEWVTDATDHGGPLVVPDADGFPVYHVRTDDIVPPDRLSMNARAREIGVTTVTLRKWRDERGVDVFDDDQVRAHIAGARNHSFKIAHRFKASLLPHIKAV